LKFIKAFKSSAATKAAAAVTAGIATGTQLESAPPHIQGDRSHSKSDSTSNSENESESDNSDASSDEGEAAVTGSDMSGDSVSDAEPHGL
jgi:hypothetical protein